MSGRFMAAILVSLIAPVHAQQPPDLGPFTALSDVGDVSRKSLVTYDRSSGIYFLSAAGANIWAGRDAFGFVWKETKGDGSISARVRFMGKSSQPHRKAGLMFRQSLAPESAYVDAVVHGDGLTALQYRATAGGPTREVQCAQEAPTALRLERRGDYFSLFAAYEDGVFSPTGCLIRVELGGKLLAGLVVSAHDDQAFENVRFSSVSVGATPERRSPRIFAIEMVDVDSLSRRILWYSSARLAVPSFTAGDDAICFREEGELKRLSLVGRAEPTRVAADNLETCATAVVPHSAGQRVIQRADGSRSQIWLEPADGDSRPLTRGKRNEWMPRLSPDAESFVFVASDARAVDGKPPLADYLLTRRALGGGEERELASFFGGPGALGVSPWSADGKRLVFMSREPEPPRR